MLFPFQGNWEHHDFLRVHTNRPAELLNRCFVILPYPTIQHQRYVRHLTSRLADWCDASGIGEALHGPIPVILFPGTIREPDIMIFKEFTNESIHDYPDASSILIAIEIVGEGDEARHRDYQAKRMDYAKAGISEYWIVDPQEKLITVLELCGEEYKTHGCFGEKQTLTSSALCDLALPCAEIWNIGGDD